MKKLSLLIIIFSQLLFFTNTFSQDGPNVWTLTYNNLGRIYAMVIDPVNQNIIYEAGLDSGIYKTTNAGLNWFQVNNGLTYNKVQCLSISLSNPLVLYAGTDQLGTTNSGVYKTTDGGNNWTLVSTGITDSKGIQSIAIHPTNPNTAWAAVFDGLVPSIDGVYKTTNGGTNWFVSSTGIDIKNILTVIVNPLNGNCLYAGSSFYTATPGSTKIYKSFDGGANWTTFSNGLPTGATTGNPVRNMSMSSIDTSVVLATLFVNDTTGGAYLTTNAGVNWTKKHGLPNVVGTLLRAGIIRPGTTNEFFVGLDGGGATTRGVWRSTNSGATWADFNGGAMLNTFTIRALVFKTTGDPTLFGGAATASPSTSRGVYEYSWPAPVVAPDYLYYKFENNPSPTTTPNCAFPSVGTNPAPLTSVTLTSGGQFDSCLAGTGATSSGINTGWNCNLGTSSWTISFWLNIPTTTAIGYLFGDAGSNGFRAFYNGAAGTNNMIVRFATGGGPGDMIINNVINAPVVITIVYDSAAGNVKGYKDGVLANTVAYVANIITGSGFRVGGYSTSAGLNGKMDEFRLYRRALTQAEITSTYNTDIACALILGINPGNNIPKVFNLYQNYPNPFNPSTIIKYSVPNAANVKIVIYDILGKEAVTLVNKFTQPGEYSVTFDGSNFANGVYFYKIEAGDFTDAKKMVLIK